MNVRTDSQSSMTRQMTAPAKISYHSDKLRAFLNGESIYPVTVEMDITTYCPLKCHDCPSTRSPQAQQFALPDIDRFFARLEGRTQGLLLSGGEPTSSPYLPEFLRLARERDFREIAIVSNGYGLDDERITAALLEDATVVRLSLYDWGDEIALRDDTVLRKIEKLRRRIDDAGSPMHIGVSALTSSDRASDLAPLAKAVSESGAHWIYFHPTCIGWGTGHLSQTSQAGVTEEIGRLQQASDSSFGVFFCPSRYETGTLEFDEYYSAHFLMVVGADGINYLGTETKYQQDYAIADITKDADFLSDPGRLARIASFNHDNYPPLGGRHRGLLYNDHVERLKADGRNMNDSSESATTYLYPHIL